VASGQWLAAGDQQQKIITNAGRVESFEAKSPETASLLEERFAMLESVLALGRTLIYDLISALSVAVVLLLVLLPLAAAVELVHLVRTARMASLRGIALRGRERLAAFRFRPQPVESSRPVIAKETPASSTKVA
jgi:hypothetical protein